MPKKQVTVEKLLAKAQDLYDQTETEAAMKFFQRALDMDNQNTDIMDRMGELCMELENPEGANQLFEESCRIAPDANASKWLYLAQCQSGASSISSFTKGIEMLKRELSQASYDLDTSSVIKSQISSAFSGLAELYMTDMCMEPNAEAECEKYLEEARKFDGEALEPIVTLSSVRLSQQRDGEAKELMLKAVTILGSYAVEALPSAEFRVSIVKQLMEVGLPAEAAEMVEQLLQENDENIELWFLAGKAYHANKENGLAHQYLTRAVEMFTKLKEQLSGNFPYAEQLAVVEEELRVVEAEGVNDVQVEGDGEEDVMELEG